MKLTVWECKKILHRRFGLAAIGLALAFSVFLGVWNALFNLSQKNYSSSGVLFELSGPENIAAQLRWADEWRGPLTGERMAAMQRQIATAYRPEKLQQYENGSLAPSNEAYRRYVSPLKPVLDLWYRTYSHLPAYSSYLHTYQLPQQLVADYYANRDKALNAFLTLQLPDPQDRAVFLAQEAQVQKPFYYDWPEGQNLYLELTATLASCTALFLCLAMAPVFAGEYQQRTDSILLCARHGRGRLARAKLGAGLLVATLTYLACAGVYLALQFFFLGTRGLGCPIQLIKPLATTPLTLWQAEALSLLLGLLHCLASVLITLLLSARLRSPFPPAAISLLLIFLPMIFNGSLPGPLQLIVDLLPFSGDYSELFRANLLHLFGLRVWSPCFYFAVPLLCPPLALRSYLRSQG